MMGIVKVVDIHLQIVHLRKDSICNMTPWRQFASKSRDRVHDLHTRVGQPELLDEHDHNSARVRKYVSEVNSIKLVKPYPCIESCNKLSNLVIALKDILVRESGASK
eukprot:CAMPEP_0204919764 /NCGR_PEP_ID=MMETSP1397-20131031/17003_1 /ASSEMBLY_ACC=CAM_ASM_000891 /TAXON_ID=49980 /ORGANISM="Climacostomum Climacostomum virens, Strain Stock W-24" /LENGTH=106 /DNA_ID=CAMNT_0052093385 /DNA_START=415 /DNA_END=735 /DNA_ORIENTATION=+